MRRFFLLVTLVISQASSDSQNYNVIELKAGMDRPFMLTTDYKTDIIYFNIVTYEGKQYNGATFNLRTNEFKTINAVEQVFCPAIDQENQIVYLGTPNGIYIYDQNTDKAEFFGASNTFIWTLFYQRELFYSTYPSQEFYAYSNGEPTLYKGVESQKVHFFLVDSDGDKFFSNDTGLYFQEGSSKAVVYKTFGDAWELRALTKDVHGNVYTCLKDGVYAIDKRSSRKISMFLPFWDCFGLTFDSKGNLIVSNGHSLYMYEKKRNGETKVL